MRLLENHMLRSLKAAKQSNKRPVQIHCFELVVLNRTLIPVELGPNG